MNEVLNSMVFATLESHLTMCPGRMVIAKLVEQGTSPTHVIFVRQFEVSISNLGQPLSYETYLLSRRLSQHVLYSIEERAKEEKAPENSP